jgi:hypothetical protein
MALSRPARDAIIAVSVLAVIAALVAAFVLWVKSNRVKRQGRVNRVLLGGAARRNAIAG